MKIRKGFVSNSSSSSFILAYDKSGILSDAEKIVEYVDNHPRDSILFKSDLCDGWDIFFLDMHQKNYLLKHKKRFIKYSGGETTVVDYDAEKDENGEYPRYERPFVEAFIKVYDFYPYPYEYEDPEVDMSDIPAPEATFEDEIASAKGIATSEQKVRVDAANLWYGIKSERVREEKRKRRERLLDEIRRDLLDKGASADNLVVEVIDVDNDSCDPDGSYDSEFAARYFGLDEDTYYEPLGDPDIE